MLIVRSHFITWQRIPGIFNHHNKNRLAESVYRPGLHIQLRVFRIIKHDHVPLCHNLHQLGEHGRSHDGPSLVTIDFVILARMCRKPRKGIGARMTCKYDSLRLLTLPTSCSLTAISLHPVESMAWRMN
jgi:hypothetical protein